MTYLKVKYFKIGSVRINEISTDGAMTGNSDLCVPTEKAVKTYVDNKAGTIDAMLYKGVIDAHTNPNYPAGDAGDFYIISVAGKIGGSSGTVVEAGDAVLCNTDGTTTGNEASKGTYWEVIQTNIADPTSFVVEVTGAEGEIPQFTAAGQLESSGASTDDFALAGHDHDADYLGIHATSDDSDGLEGHAASYFATSGHDHDGDYLAIGGTSADSDGLEGHAASYFAIGGHNHDADYIAIDVGAATGDILYFDGAAWQNLAIGASGEVLTVSAGGLPVWS